MARRDSISAASSSGDTTAAGASLAAFTSIPETLVDIAMRRVPPVRNPVGRPSHASIRAKAEAKMKTIVESRAREQARSEAMARATDDSAPEAYDSAPEPFNADDDGAKITKRAGSDKETPQKGERKKKRRLQKPKVLALMERLTDEIVKPAGTPTPIKAITSTTETQTPKLAIEEPKITILMLPSHEKPETKSKPAPKAKPKPKNKAKTTTAKRKPAMVKQDEKATKKQQPPSKVSVQVIRELFEDAKHKKAITAAVYLEFVDVWKHVYANKGNKEIKAVDSKKLKELYAEHLRKKIVL
jgi:hypothetical protein